MVTVVQVLSPERVTASQFMKSIRMGTITLFLFLGTGNFGTAWAQNAGSVTESRHLVPAWNQQSTQILLVPPQLTNFELYASNADQPLVHVSFPEISADLGPHISLSLTPRGLTPFDAPGALKALAVEFHLTQSPQAARSTEVSQWHSVTTLLDFDELFTFKTVFNALAATGMPQPPFSEAKAVVRITSKSGMRMEFTEETSGRIRCVVSTDAESVVLSLDADSARRWADAFTAAFRTLDAAKDSRT